MEVLCSGSEREGGGGGGDGDARLNSDFFSRVDFCSLALGGYLANWEFFIDHDHDQCP